MVVIGEAVAEVQEEFFTILMLPSETELIQ
jgi:hypothetical protein